MTAMDAELIMIIEDEVKIARLLADYLEPEGFRTRLWHEGTGALEQIRTHNPALVILDLMLPGMDGITLCRELRTFSRTPVLMLTARVDEIDRPLGLRIGADDYVCKPFLPREVVARVQAILRRMRPPTPEVTPASREPALQYRDLTLYPERYRCEAAGQSVELTPLEFRMLQTLMSRPGRVYSREKLMELCYTDNRIISDRTI
ncbi:MAG: response regulator, partial [Thiothrix sp.]|nr:response regulator [Thiothrix sp.]